MSQAESLLSQIRRSAHARRALAHCLEASQPTRYIVETRDFRDPGQTLFAEVGADEATLPALIANLVSGQYDRIVSVREIGPDVSCEIAKAVARHCEDFGLAVTADVRVFLEDHGQEAPQFDEEAA